MIYQSPWSVEKGKEMGVKSRRGQQIANIHGKVGGLLISQQENDQYLHPGFLGSTSGCLWNRRDDNREATK